MPKIRHIAIATQDPEAMAQFLCKGFEFKELRRFGDFSGKAEGKSYGMYLTDGTLNLAIIKFGWSQGGKSLDFVGLHHFGVEVDDIDEYAKRLESLGADCFAEKPKDTSVFYEVKFTGPEGLLFDISDKPWLGSKSAKSES
jgi:catechol 2,3-dioxygenase-like lactoylglutathione lyase family enzyme